MLGFYFYKIGPIHLLVNSVISSNRLEGSFVTYPVLVFNSLDAINALEIRK